ncbi:MAG: hypothetical protein HY617_03555 [Candidatus Sungbacteria bacterium]|nr:hypothetical protein [Candidatus Sungbacteria bacterium]
MGKSDLAVALDVGSRTIKGLVYGISDNGSIIKGHKRVAIEMPAAYTADRIVGELHTMLASAIKEFGRVPAKVTAGFGTSLADYRVEQWDMEPGAKAHLDRKDMVEYFGRLFEQHTKEDRAMIATPAGVEVNGYPLLAEVLRRDVRHSLIAPGETVHSIRFRTLVSYFPPETGALLAEMKQMLGGVPIEFIPLASAYQEALAQRLNVRDAVLIDVGGTSTMVVMLKDGALAQTAAFPLGVSQIGGKPVRSGDKKLIALWSRSLNDALDFLYPFGPLTGETYLCGGGAYLSEVRAYIEQGEWLKTLSYAAAPNVTVLEGKSLFADNMLKGFLQGPEDAGLASVICYGMHHEVII